MADCNTTINDAICKIFYFQRWQSTRTLREGFGPFGYPSLYETFAKAKKQFFDALENHSNSILSSLHQLTIVQSEFLYQACSL